MSRGERKEHEVKELLHTLGRDTSRIGLFTYIKNCVLGARSWSRIRSGIDSIKHSYIEGYDDFAPEILINLMELPSSHYRQKILNEKDARAYVKTTALNLARDIAKRSGQTKKLTELVPSDAPTKVFSNIMVGAQTGAERVRRCRRNAKRRQELRDSFDHLGPVPPAYWDKLAEMFGVDSISEITTEDLELVYDIASIRQQHLLEAIEFIFADRDEKELKQVEELLHLYSGYGQPLPDWILAWHKEALVKVRRWCFGEAA